jgi:hypothetical protein
MWSPEAKDEVLEPQFSIPVLRLSFLPRDAAAARLFPQEEPGPTVAPSRRIYMHMYASHFFLILSSKRSVQGLC